jgi:hypothetical protein
LFVLGSLAVAACADPSSQTPLSPAFDEIVVEAEPVETLKEEEGPIDEPGTCSTGYELTLTKKGSLIDQNENGYVCFNPETGDVVDDHLKPEGPDTEFAGGHGNILVQGKKEIPQDISFSFHGRQNKLMVVKGEFEMHDQLNGLRIHGAVTCLRVLGNRATLGGVIDQSTDKQLPVGALVVWETVDNGEGTAGEVPDQLSRPALAGKLPKEGCQSIAVKGHPTIVGGNIQVIQ